MGPEPHFLTNFILCALCSILYFSIMNHVIAFDADDTLWVNEPYFRETEDKFCALLEDYLPSHTTGQELFKVEMNNLALYGYGLSLIHI